MPHNVLFEFLFDFWQVTIMLLVFLFRHKFIAFPELGFPSFIDTIVSHRGSHTRKWWAWNKIVNAVSECRLKPESETGTKGQSLWSALQRGNRFASNKWIIEAWGRITQLLTLHSVQLFRFAVVVYPLIRQSYR